jgi:glycine/D-amino acid oxidase-like deaminating enzyme
MHDFIVVGGGIFGLTSAISLRKRGYSVGLLNPDTIPHHLAASTDISKLIRMEYGSDKDYFRMAEICIDKWNEWNDLFNEELYQEIGLLMLSKANIDTKKSSYERDSIHNLSEAGYAINRLNANNIKERFPAVNTNTYIDGNFNPMAGHVASGRAVECLADYARSLGVEIHEGQTAAQFKIENGQLNAVSTTDGETFKCGHLIVAAGAYTPYLLPELAPNMRSTGHPVFWLKPSDQKLFSPPLLPNFTTDISESGWYGFAYNSKHGVVKLGKHSDGIDIDPNGERKEITKNEILDMREYLKITFPDLEKAPLVYARRCLYTDTLDGHFWIDNHPEIKGLSVSTGGSGHGFKMGPILGEMTADIAEGKTHEFSARFRWRNLSSQTKQMEEARLIQSQNNELT